MAESVAKSFSTSCCELQSKIKMPFQLPSSPNGPATLNFPSLYNRVMLAIWPCCILSAAAEPGCDCCLSSAWQTNIGEFRVWIFYPLVSKGICHIQWTLTSPRCFFSWCRIFDEVRISARGMKDFWLSGESRFEGHLFPGKKPWWGYLFIVSTNRETKVAPKPPPGDYERRLLRSLITLCNFRSINRALRKERSPGALYVPTFGRKDCNEAQRTHRLPRRIGEVQVSRRWMSGCRPKRRYATQGTMSRVPIAGYKIKAS